MTQLYTNELVSLEKKIETLEVKCGNSADFDIEFLYDLERCTDWILKHNLKRVCLQFPDYLLHDVSQVVKLLESLVGMHVYVMGDTTYESCCVDFISAAHVNADGIIHFGSTCFSKPCESIPTLFVYEKTKFDLDKLFNAFADFFSADSYKEVSIVLDTPFLYKKEQVLLVQDIDTNISVHGLDERNINVENRRVLYVGDNNDKLMIFSQLFKPKELFYYNNCQPDNIQTYCTNSRSVKRRGYLREVVKDSKMVGIIMGTVAVKNYKVIMQRMIKLCKLHHKKYYLISVGKPTVAKLANYPELDIYVLIGCPLNSIFESRDFYKPIATPYDVELALNPSPKEIFYHDLSSLADNNDDLDNVTVNVSDVSLLTGMVRVTDDTREAILNNGNSSQIAKRSDGTLIQRQTGSVFLHSRSWKGLEQHIGTTEVQPVQEGRKGIASEYKSEPK